MNKSFVLLLTSYSEGFPLVCPEALSSGLPIIAFKPDGKRVVNNSDEIVEDNINGFLVKTEKEMAKKIELLFKNKNLKRRMKNKALKISKKFSWEKIAEKILDMTKPDISVIMTVYNDEKYLKDAIKSLLNQKFQNFELIFIDDNSSDNSLKIAKQFAKNDKRIRIFSLNKNIGQFKAINKFLKKIRGEYVTFLDGDDLLDKRRLKEQLNFMKQNNLDFSYCDMLILYKDGNKRIRKTLDYKKDFRKKLIKKSKQQFDLETLPGLHLSNKKTVFGGGFIFKKEVLNKCSFDLSLPRMHDHDFWFQVIGKKGD